MSGNPFRASLHLHSSPNPSATAVPPTTSFINPDDRAEEAREYEGRDTVAVHDAATRAKTKKSVRIESPTEIIPPHPVFHDVESPLYPASPHRQSYAHNLGSPPLSPPAALSDSFEDTGVDDARGPGEEDDKRRMNKVSKRSSGTPEGVLSPSGAPHNPFARTLASTESQETGGGEVEGQHRDRTSTERPQPPPPRASLDVEGFKNLLLTGITSPRSSGPPQQTAPTSNPVSASVFESSSSTDTSSGSRQSIFESPVVRDPNPETPRTSYEMAASDDEQVKPVGELNNKREKRKPPPAPKSRHGKLVSPRAPQTVAFESFAVTEPAVSPPSTAKGSRNSSEFKKPLPATPPIVSPQSSHIFPQDSMHDLPSIPDSKGSETSSLSDAAPAQKKVPPPVPLARRHSQLKSSTAENRSRSSSSLTISSQHSIDLPTLPPNLEEAPTSSPSSAPKAPSPSKVPPPPPPTRHRGAALATIGASSANSSSTELSTATRRPTVTSPTPPSSRRPTMPSEPPSPASGLARTSSMNSTRTSHRIVSNESTTSTTMPPPPPPPRRRQSGRSSLDKERPMPAPTTPTENRSTSMEYKRRSPDSKRRTSVASESSLKYEYAPVGATAEGSEQALYSPQEEKGEEKAREEKRKSVEQVTTASILDDMDRFQKEIEELRAKYRHAT